ncbi:hypothetical protein [Pacificibacter marinus]|uniref:hypothetical protein n=1 Tax=Pacificibacter marinus TaxID=658057 RepID=UPI000A2687FB|nr:hypothetical protein [Pacificibacter marinus]
MAEIAEIKAQNFAAELEARNRKKDIQRRLAEGPHNPWLPTPHGPMREVILMANKEWFDAELAAVFGEGVEVTHSDTDGCAFLFSVGAVVAARFAVACHGKVCR